MCVCVCGEEAPFVVKIGKMSVLVNVLYLFFVHEADLQIDAVGTKLAKNHTKKDCLSYNIKLQTSKKFIKSSESTSLSSVSGVCAVILT